MPQPFHLAFAVSSLTACRDFYCGVLGCKAGRATEHWLDIDFFGHQLSAHLSDVPPINEYSNVDGVEVPLRHFGVVLELNDWRRLVDKITAANIDFVIEPQCRYQGKRGEQYTFFIKDPSGNGLEFKAFNNPDELFSG